MASDAVLALLDKCKEAVNAFDQDGLRDNVRALMRACSTLADDATKESGETLAASSKALVNTIVETFSGSFSIAAQEKLHEAIGNVRSATETVTLRDETEPKPESNPYDNFSSDRQLESLYDANTVQRQPEAQASFEEDDEAEPMYPEEEGDGFNTDDSEASDPPSASSDNYNKRKSVFQRMLSVDPEAEDEDRVTPALSQSIEYHVEAIEEETEKLFQAAEDFDIQRMASTAKALFQSFSTLRKFAGHEHDLPPELERVYRAVKSASTSVTAYLHTAATKSDARETLGPALVDSIINVSVVMHDFIAGMRRVKFRSQVPGQAAHTLITRVVASFDKNEQPLPKEEQVDFLHCKHTLLLCSQALLASLQQLTAAVLSPQPEAWKLASICDNIASHVKHLVHVSDSLHDGKAAPLRRIAFETCQVLLGGVNLLCKPEDLTSNEFHAAVNSLHDSIPALRSSAHDLFTQCLELANHGEVRELTKKELEAEVEVKVKLDLSVKPEQERVTVDCYLGTKAFKDAITSQMFPIGQIVSLSDMSGSTTLAEVKEELARKYDTSGAGALILLSPDTDVNDDMQLSELASEHNRVRLVIYDRRDSMDMEKERENLVAGRYPEPDNDTVIKLMSPKEGPTTRLKSQKRESTSSSSPRALRRMNIDINCGHEDLSPAAQATVCMERELQVPHRGALSISRRHLKKRRRSKPAQSVMEGFLMKEGGSRRSWRLRWFVLADDELVYFKSPSDQAPLGLVSLEEFKRCEQADFKAKQKPFGIQLIPSKPGARVYSLAAASEEERRRWVHGIDSNIPSRRPYAERLSLLNNLIDHLQEIGSTKEDLFRISGSEQHIKGLLHTFELRRAFNIEDIVNPYTLTGLIKKILKTCAVGPLLPSSAQELMQRAVADDAADDAQLCSIRMIFNSELMTSDEHSVICNLMSLFHSVLDHAAITNTTVDEICLSFGKALFPQMGDEWAQQVLHLVINNSDELFPQCPCSGGNKA